MIPLKFEYHRPETAEEAVDAYRRLAREGKDPLYYGGGTEILTLARVDEVETGAVLDLKGVPECRVLERHGDELRIGAGLTLAEIAAADLWPLLTAAAERVADHSSRCKITLGGNIAGRIPYREAVLPFLLVDAEAVVAGPDGLRRVPFERVFDGALHLRSGEFLAQLAVPRADTELPYFCVKKTRLDWIDYPLLALAAVRRGDRLRVAIAGLCGQPFRASRMEDALSAGRWDEAVERIPDAVVDDVHGSAAYRRFVLGNTLADALSALEG